MVMTKEEFDSYEKKFYTAIDSEKAKCLVSDSN